ncbi:isochorismatase family cysteine hydrolase [Parasphingorhabdus sp.]|jgi:nicotinamidase-related amidase|uniref:isochorismatase family cysteine hydrolase n=1 Tax=Parasphingorhabdus sp. TaxID=2709688 RepID=UPI003D29FC2B
MMHYPKSKTAFLLIDPFNDFLSPFGKTWPVLRDVSKDVNLMHNLRKAVELARREGLQVVYAPHHKYRKGSYADRKYLHPSQYLQSVSRMFGASSYGGKFHKHFQPNERDIIASEHECSSGFVGTDLQAVLEEHGISHLILAGLLSNTCVESTARSAIDLGYHVTLLPDCVATWSRADHMAAVDHSYKHLGHQILSLSELEVALRKSAIAHA